MSPEHFINWIFPLGTIGPMLVVHVVNAIHVNQPIDIIHKARLGRKVILASERFLIIRIEVRTHTIFPRILTPLPKRRTCTGKYNYKDI